jgi:catechol 2,3-dioxygenase-like lactoylglutathione lyase family enzyme
MLSGARSCASLPCRDLARARSFYADKLGLVPADEKPDRLFYQEPDGSAFLLFLSSGVPSGTHDQLRFSVPDLEPVVRDLKQRGVRFERYDFPGFDQATSIAWVTDHQAAWFKDTEGNLILIVQLPPSAPDA